VWNTASGWYSSVIGSQNVASGDYSSVNGGSQNTASGGLSSVSGGVLNWAGNVCSGGTNPGARCLDNGGCTGGGTCGTNTHQSVSGGLNNEASGSYSSVTGGASNSASGTYDSAVGDTGDVYVDGTAVH